MGCTLDNHRVWGVLFVLCHTERMKCEHQTYKHLSLIISCMWIYNFNTNTFFLQHFISFSDEEQENLIVALAPVLEYVQPSPEVCAFFSKHCKGQLYNNEVLDVFLPAVHRILKHNMDFGKYPHLRMFVQDYIYTLFCKDYADVVREFVER